MNLTLWNRRTPASLFGPFNGGLSRLRDEMDRSLERLVQEPLGWLEPKALRSEGWLPALDVSETDSEVTVRVEVPGIPVKDLDISITGRILTISGAKEEQQEKKEENFYQCERRFGSFRRMVELPETVDAEKVTADADNGVVTVHIAKKPSAKPKQVEVKAAAKKVAVTG